MSRLAAGLVPPAWYRRSAFLHGFGTRAASTNSVRWTAPAGIDTIVDVTAFEVTLLVFCVVSAISMLRLHRRPAVAVWSSAFAVAAWAAQLYVEGADVYLVLVYLYLTLVAVLLRPLYRRPARARAPRVLGGLGIAACALTAAALFVASPPQIPPLSGSYPVGVAYARVRPDDPARILCFYPADLPGAYRKPPPRARIYETQGRGTAALGRLADQLGIPAYALSRLRSWKLPGYARVPVSGRRDRYPVAVISPPDGWCGESVFYLGHELASHGAVVMTGGCGLSAAEIAEAIAVGVPDEALAGRLERERVETVRLDNQADAPPQQLTDVDLLTRFPSFFGLSGNAAVRKAVVPELVRRFSRELVSPER